MLRETDETSMQFGTYVAQCARLKGMVHHRNDWTSSQKGKRSCAPLVGRVVNISFRAKSEGFLIQLAESIPGFPRELSQQTAFVRFLEGRQNHLMTRRRKSIHSPCVLPRYTALIGHSPHFVEWVVIQAADAHGSILGVLEQGAMANISHEPSKKSYSARGGGARANHNDRCPTDVVLDQTSLSPGWRR